MPPAPAPPRNEIALRELQNCRVIMQGGECATIVRGERDAFIKEAGCRCARGQTRYIINMAQKLCFWLILSSGLFARTVSAADYRFDRTISREVLENYLSRSITMEGLLNGRGDLDDNIRMLKHTGAKFIGRSLCLWGGEANLLHEPRTGEAAGPQGPRGRPGDDPPGLRLRDRDHAGRAGAGARVGVRRAGPAGGEAELPLRRHDLPRRPAPRHWGRQCRRCPT